MQYQAFRGTLGTSCLLALLVGCADLNDTGLLALSTKVTAHAIVDEQLVQGEMVLFPDHTGTITMRADAAVPGVFSDAASVGKPSAKQILTSCFGRLRYNSTTSGTVDLRCNSGAMADLRMALIGETRGYGYGQTATGLASLVFGLNPVEARAHLTVPPGKQLVENTESHLLELK